MAWAQDEEFPQWDIFAGYAWMEPGGDIAGTTIDEMPRGWGATATYNFDKWWGLSLDFGGNYGDNADVGTIMVGPRFSFRSDSKITPYGHARLGLHRLSPVGLESSNKIGIAVGGGLDFKINRRFDLRIIEADYVWAQHNFTPLDRPSLTGARLRTGVVVKFGGEPPIPPSASCTAEPSQVMAGEPVRVTATGANFAQGRTLSYTWSSTGGSVQGTDSAATVDTNGLGPGSYTVTARISDGKKGSASCSASFSVKEPPRNPPRISCSANPTTVMSGDASTISCSCNSPDNRSLSYSWTASSGRLSESGATAQLDTAGLPASTVTIHTTCTDDRGLSDSTSTQVSVTVPPPPPQAEKINECAFKKNNARVDNACKAALDDVALRLQRDADARAVVVGQADADERRSAKLSLQRADNTKAYLVKEKGIDPSRIETRAGSDGGQRVEVWIVPPGATF
ncbi:MAG: OmpA family protein [Acidobacteria bacterium]|nr:OmpA family protein [Acidobacteriota bacterium]